MYPCSGHMSFTENIDALHGANASVTWEWGCTVDKISTAR